MRVRNYLLAGLFGLVLTGCNANSPKAPDSQENSAAPQTQVQPGDNEQAQSSTPEDASANLLYLDVKGGRIEIELLPELAPNHVKRITTLTEQGFYDGIVFHRVIDGFMAQTGDPTGTGRGGSKLPDLKAEFSRARFERGVLGMARSSNPDSANSQFFIMLADGDFLNGEYTVFGKVVKGMEIVDGIKKGDKNNNGAVSDPDKIIKMQMAPKS